MPSNFVIDRMSGRGGVTRWCLQRRLRTTKLHLRNWASGRVADNQYTAPLPPKYMQMLAHWVATPCRSGEGFEVACSDMIHGIIVGVAVRDSFRSRIGPIRDIGGSCLDCQNGLGRFTAEQAATAHRRGRSGLRRERVLKEYRKGPARVLVIDADETREARVLWFQAKT